VFALPTLTVVDDATADEMLVMLFAELLDGVATTLQTGLGSEELDVWAVRLPPVLRATDGLDVVVRLDKDRV
jgi:hypothetical protein